MDSHPPEPFRTGCAHLQYYEQCPCLRSCCRLRNGLCCSKDTCARARRGGTTTKLTMFYEVPSTTSTASSRNIEEPFHCNSLATKLGKRVTRGVPSMSGQDREDWRETMGITEEGVEEVNGVGQRVSQRDRELRRSGWTGCGGGERRARVKSVIDRYQRLQCSLAFQCHLDGPNLLFTF